MRTLLLLGGLWGSVSAAALRRWWRDRAVDRRDQHLRALLAGAIVPAPRTAADDEPAPARDHRAGTTNSAADAPWVPEALIRTR